MPKLVDLLKAGATHVRKVNWPKESHLEFPKRGIGVIPTQCVLHSGGEEQDFSFSDVNDGEDYWEKYSPELKPLPSKKQP